MASINLLLLAETLQYLTTATLVGLIWTIQLVHYPAFRYVDRDQFVNFHKMHTLRITLFVAPVMVVELMAALYLLFVMSFSGQQLLLSLLVLGTWLSTFFLSVPQHNILAQGKDEKRILKLIQYNWVRTTLWTLKLIFLLLFSTLL